MDNGLAAGLVLVSAVGHAFWNWIAKRADNNLAFQWIFTLFEVVLFAPIILIGVLMNQIVFTQALILTAFGSALFHLLYFWLLLTGYRVGDLSIVYPLARGLGPAFAAFGAVLLFAERPDTFAVIGILLISAGAILLTGNPQRLMASSAMPGVVFGLLTAFSVAGFTLWDAYSVKTVQVMPLPYLFVTSISRSVLLAPFVLRQREKLRVSWDRDHWKALIIGFFSPGCYLLVLLATALADVSYVTPLRATSILIGVLIGVNILKEGDAPRRVFAAVLMVGGVIFLNL